MSRLTIDITEQQHQSIKAMAALQGKSIKEYAVERLFPQASGEEQALSELKQLLQQRMAQANRGEVSTKSITEVADDAIRAGGGTA
jgi:Antitoxin ParD